MAGLPRNETGIEATRELLGHRAERLAAWFERLANLLGRPHGTTVATLEPPTFGSLDLTVATSRSHYGIWLCEHLDHLSEHLGELVRPATRLAEIRRRPWWR